MDKNEPDKPVQLLALWACEQLLNTKPVAMAGHTTPHHTISACASFQYTKTTGIVDAICLTFFTDSEYISQFSQDGKQNIMFDRYYGF